MVTSRESDGFRLGRTYQDVQLSWLAVLLITSVIKSTRACSWDSWPSGTTIHSMRKPWQSSPANNT